MKRLMSFLGQNPRATSSFAILLLAAALASCRGGEADNSANVTSDANQVVTSIPAVPIREPALNRAELLAAVAKAASAAALGAADGADQLQLDGRQFEVRIRFGCRGPSSELSESWLGWTQEPGKNTLRVRAKPTISIEDPTVATIAGEQVEAVEGFWIPRPWLLQAECPAGAATLAPEAQQSPGPDVQMQPNKTPQKKPVERVGDQSLSATASQQPEEPLPAAPRVGIAQFFTATDARTGRRDNRAYEAVKALDEGAGIVSRGFDLVLSGRLRALPGRKVINCTTNSFDQPPECLVSVKFDRVRIEQPGSAEVIAEWRAQ
jgi:hypothetical protein